MGAGEEEPKRRPRRLSTKCAPAKVETKPKKRAGKDESSDRKVQTKEKRGAKGKQVEVATSEIEDLPASNGETEKIKKSRGYKGNRSQEYSKC